LKWFEGCSLSLEGKRGNPATLTLALALPTPWRISVSYGTPSLQLALEAATMAGATPSVYAILNPRLP